jgi:hypothetical protein
MISVISAFTLYLSGFVVYGVFKSIQDYQLEQEKENRWKRYQERQTWSLAKTLS